MIDYMKLGGVAGQNGLCTQWLEKFLHLSTRGACNSNPPIIEPRDQKTIVMMKRNMASSDPWRFQVLFLCQEIEEREWVCEYLSFLASPRFCASSDDVWLDTQLRIIVCRNELKSNYYAASDDSQSLEGSECETTIGDWNSLWSLPSSPLIMFVFVGG